MKLSEGITNREMIEEVIDRIIYDRLKNTENRDYSARLKEVYNLYESKATKACMKNLNIINELIPAIIGEVSEVYTQIGIRAGTLIVIEIIHSTISTDQSHINIPHTYMQSKSQLSFASYFTTALEAIRLNTDESLAKAEHILEFLELLILDDQLEMCNY